MAEPQDRLAEQIEFHKSFCPGYVNQCFDCLLIARVEQQDRLLAKAEESIAAAFEDGKNRAAGVVCSLSGEGICDADRAVAAIRALKPENPHGS